MDDTLRAKALELRSRGLNAREIARATGLSQAEARDLIKQMASDQAVHDVAERTRFLATGKWREGLSLKAGVPTGAQFPGLVPRGDSEPRPGRPSLVQLCVLTDRGRGRADLTLFLLDTACLGVKNALSKRNREQDEIGDILSRLEEVHGGSLEEVTAVTARELVYGSMDYAASLGFKPHPDALPLLPVLGGRAAGCIQFGWYGRPYFINGPDDDVAKIRNTLEQRVGPGGYEFLLLG